MPTYRRPFFTDADKSRLVVSFDAGKVLPLRFGRGLCRKSDEQDEQGTTEVVCIK